LQEVYCQELQGTEKNYKKKKEVNRMKPKCPHCKKIIKALMKDVEAEEHFRVWIDEVDKSYQEKSVFYDINSATFSCGECLKTINDIPSMEDAIKFLKGEKI
jgi:thiol-disulfide isomerase/thioredoxin